MINKRQLLLSGLAMTIPSKVYADSFVTIPLHKTAIGALTVQVMINNQGPFTFLVDIGSGISWLPAALSNSLKLQLIGDALDPYIVNVGTQTYAANRVNAIKVGFGPELIRRNMVFMRIPNVALATSEYDASVGSALVLTQPCIVDFEKPEIRVYSDKIMPLDGFQSVPADIKQSGVSTSRISLQCNFAGLTEMLGVNAIRQNGIYLMPGYVREHKLWDQFSEYSEYNNAQDSSPSAQPLTKAPLRRVKLKDVSLGSFKLAEIDLWLSNPDIEDPADEEVGFVCGDILSKFDLAFDAKKQVWLKPNASFDEALPD